MIPHNNPLTGAAYLFRAFPLLLKPGLKRYVAGPIAINLLLFALMLWISIESFHYMVTWINAHIPSWLHWLDWLFWLLFAASFLVFSIFTFTLFAGIIAAPFSGLLAEKLEMQLTGKAPENYTLTDFFKDIPRMMKREWQKLAYFIPRAVGILVLFLIPGVNLVAPFIWIMFNAWMVAVQYLDYPMDNHRMSFQALKETLRKQRMTSLGFGGVVMLATLLPGINLFVIPAGVIGGTLIWVDSQKQGG